MRKLFSILSIAFFFSSCTTKDEPLAQNGTPVFRISGTVDGKPLFMEAGKNGYKMDGDYTLDAKNVFTFIGNLAKEGCASCGPALKVTVRNYIEGATFMADSSLAADDYAYLNKDAPHKYFKVNFNSQADGGQNSEYDWDLGNGKTANSKTVKGMYVKSGKYTITHQYRFDGGNSILSQDIRLSEGLSGRNIDFNFNSLDPLNVLFNSEPTAMISSNVLWDFGDASPAANGNIIQHTYAASGEYKVCVTYFEGADTILWCKLVNTNGEKKLANFSYKADYIVDSLDLSSSIIEWTDEAGVVYSSANIVQDNSAVFKVIDSKDYLNNARGQKTRLLSVLVNCKVSNSIKTLELKNVTATIAVAIP